MLKEADIHVHTNTTVNRLNAPHLTELIRLVKDLGMDRFLPGKLGPELHGAFVSSRQAPLPPRVGLVDGVIFPCRGHASASYKL